MPLKKKSDLGKKVKKLNRAVGKGLVASGRKPTAANINRRKVNLRNQFGRDVSLMTAAENKRLGISTHKLGRKGSKGVSGKPPKIKFKRKPSKKPRLRMRPTKGRKPFKLQG